MANANLQLALNVVAQEMEQRYERAMASGFKGTATDFVKFDLTQGDIGEMIAQEFLMLAMTTDEKVKLRVDELIDNSEAAQASVDWWNTSRTIAHENGDLIEIAALCIAQLKMKNGQ